MAFFESTENQNKVKHQKTTLGHTVTSKMNCRVLLCKTRQFILLGTVNSRRDDLFCSSLPQIPSDSSKVDSDRKL